MRIVSAHVQGDGKERMAKGYNGPFDSFFFFFTFSFACGYSDSSFSHTSTCLYFDLCSSLFDVSCTQIVGHADPYRKDGGPCDAHMKTRKEADTGVCFV